MAVLIDSESRPVLSQALAAVEQEHKPQAMAMLIDSESQRMLSQAVTARIAHAAEARAGKLPQTIAMRSNAQAA